MENTPASPAPKEPSFLERAAGALKGAKDNVVETAKDIDRSAVIDEAKKALGDLKKDVGEKLGAVRDVAQDAMYDTIDFGGEIVFGRPDKLDATLRAVERRLNKPIDEIIMKSPTLALRIRQVLNAYAANDPAFKRQLDCATLVERIKDGDYSRIQELMALTGESYLDRAGAFVFRGAAKEKIMAKYEASMAALTAKYPVLNRRSMIFVVRSELYPPVK